MKKIIIDFIIKIESNEDWVLLIATNRSTIFKPVILKKRNNVTTINIKTKIEGYRNYLNLKKNNINNSLMYFYSFIYDKDRNLQINKCKCISLLEFISLRNKTIKLNSIFLTINNNNTINLNEAQLYSLKIISNEKKVQKEVKQIFSYSRLFQKNDKKTFKRFDYNTTNRIFTYAKFKNNRYDDLMKHIKNNKADKYNDKVTLSSFFKGINLFKTSNTYNVSDKAYQIYTTLSNYKKKINKALVNIFHPNYIWHVIYFDLNVFFDMPIISSIIMDKEKSNEEFWYHLYKATFEVYNNFGIEWNMKESWVNILTIFNTLYCDYVLEKDDIYMEGWYTTHIDCDEANMIKQMYTLFINCDFVEYEDLKIMQYWAKQYIDTIGFLYVTTESASMDYRGEPKNPIGHWAAIFWPKKWFFEHCTLRSLENFEDSNGLNILIGEPTAFMYPSLSRYKEIPDIIKEQRNIRFLKDNTFYTHLNTIYTDRFLDNHNIIGFYCSILVNNGKLKYKIPYNYLISNQIGNKNMDLRIRFIPFPTISKKLKEFAISSVDQRMYIPNFIMKNNIHEKTFLTNENIEEKIIKVENFLNKKFIILNDERSNHKHFLILSIDDLIFKYHNLSKYFGHKIFFKKIELLYKCYVYFVKIY